MKYVGETEDGLELAAKLANMGGTIKVTKIEKFGWNEFSGQDYMVNIKATAPKGKRWITGGKATLFQFTTNSTWLEDVVEYGDETDQELIQSMVSSACL